MKEFIPSKLHVYGYETPPQKAVMIWDQAIERDRQHFQEKYPEVDIPEEELNAFRTLESTIDRYFVSKLVSYDFSLDKLGLLPQTRFAEFPNDRDANVTWGKKGGVYNSRPYMITLPHNTSEDIYGTAFNLSHEKSNSSNCLHVS